MQDALNKQINEEMYSSYLYLQMSAWFQSGNLSGFANWMYVQSQEETAHAMRIYNFVNQRGAKVVLGQIEAPPSEWESPLDAFQAAHRHEQRISACFDKLMALAVEEKDNASGLFFQWFVAEQVEEEASASEIVEKLKLIEGAPAGLLALDRELSDRALSGPSGAESGTAE
jgi:ferritin